MSIKFLSGIFCFLVCSSVIRAQPKNWTLKECIEYAQQNNIDVRKSYLSTEENELSLEQSKANRLPSVTGSVAQSFNWSRSYQESDARYGSLNGTDNTSYSVSSGMTLFNNFRLKNEIKQAGLTLESGKYYSETVKESLELSILDAYLQILYAKESVNNAREQVHSTTDQLNLAEERMNVGAISKADYLQIKSELATEKLTLANAESTLEIAKVDLMQLMELPVNDQFEVLATDMTAILAIRDNPVAAEVYAQSLAIKPQIKEASLTVESSKLDEKIAKADLLPELSLSAGVSSSWSGDTDGFSYAEQLDNTINPSVGLTLSIPIFQNKSGRINVQKARLSVTDAELDEISTKNELRKSVEQACVDLRTAQVQYEATTEQFESAQESYLVATEKYEIGIINAVDFLTVKTDLITAESDLVQAKYNLIYCNKVLDFYKGIPVAL